MASNRLILAASVAAALSLSACSEQDENPTNSGGKTYDTNVTVIDAVVTGTVRVAPYRNVRDQPVADEVQSVYSSTTRENREYRRGLIEFARVTGNVHKAVLALTPGGGSISHPVAPDTHTVSWYRSNQTIDNADFDRAATSIATFLTDNNDTVWPTLYFDVTAAVKATGTDGPAFRVALKDDLSITFDGSMGAGFHGTSSEPPPQLIITTLRER